MADEDFLQKLRPDGRFDDLVDLPGRDLPGEEVDQEASADGLPGPSWRVPKSLGEVVEFVQDLAV